MAQIRALAPAAASATQNELPEEFVGLFRADAIWTGGGKRLFGRDEISAFTQQVLPGGMKGLTITMEVAHVLFIRADVAARQLYISDDGRPSEDVGEGTPLFVMAKEDEQWRLVACQNTGMLDA